MELKEKIKVVSRIVKDGGISGFLNIVRLQYDLWFRPSKINHQPVSLQLEPNTRCNLRCLMCEHSFDDLNKPDLSYDQFVSIIDQFPYLKNLTLQGLGEPLLNQDLIKMIKAAKQRNIRVSLTTNGTLLNEKKSGELIDSGLDWIFVSLDSLEKNLYEKVRVGSNLEIVKRNIENFSRLRKGREINFGFWVLLLKDNVSEIPQIIEYAESKGLDKVVIQVLHNWGYDKFKGEIDGLKGAGEQINHLLDVLRYRKNKISIEIFRTKKDGQQCNWPWRAVYITTDGFVTPCCMNGSDPKIINFGNIFQGPFESIVNNNNYVNFRKALSSSNPPMVCRNCPALYREEVIRI